MHIKMHSIKSCVREKTLSYFNKLLQRVHLKERTIFIWKPTLIMCLITNVRPPGIQDGEEERGGRREDTLQSDGVAGAQEDGTIEKCL